MRTMDNHNDMAGNGHASLAVCLITGILAWFDTHSLSGILKDLSFIVSIIAGIMAIRYYYYSTKNKNK